MLRIITFERDDALVEGFISPYYVAEDAAAAVRASVGQGDGWGWAELTGPDDEQPRFEITMPDPDDWAFRMRLGTQARKKGLRVVGISHS